TLYRSYTYRHTVFNRSSKMKYRSRTDLVSSILETANGGTTKTKIMYQAFHSYSQLKEYLAMLLHNELLAHDMDNNMYHTTSKGIRFLENSRQLDDLLNEHSVGANRTCQ